MHITNLTKKKKKNMKNKRNKSLNKIAMLKNICGLSIGDSAYCGPYGTVTCIKSASNTVLLGEYNHCANYRGMQKGFKRNTRRFSVSGSTKIHNGGNYTMASLRKAICG